MRAIICASKLPRPNPTRAPGPSAPFRPKPQAPSPTPRLTQVNARSDSPGPHWSHEHDPTIRYGAAAPVRRAGTALHLLSNCTPVRHIVRRSRVSRARTTIERGSDSATALALPAHPVLLQPL